jgi:hypothetical protein
MIARSNTEIAMSIHDAPLTNYPRLIATLIRQRTLKIVRRELQAQGVELEQVPSAYIRALVQAFVESHRAELIRVACDTVLTADRLRRLAESEAQRRAEAYADRLAQHRSAVLTLAMQRAKKAVQASIRAKGQRIADFSAREITLLAEDYLAQHREQLRAEAEHAIATWPGFARWRVPSRPDYETDSAKSAIDLTR